MKHDIRLKSLERQVGNAVKVFDKAIQNLEKSNQKYTELKATVEEEMKTLNQTASDITDKIKKNERLLTNFKKMLD